LLALVQAEEPPAIIRRLLTGTFFDGVTQYIVKNLAQLTMSPPTRALMGPEAKSLPISDEEVVQRVRAGETGLFEVVMRRYNQRLYRVARAILRNDAEAEDVMQQAYVNAYLHLEQFENRATFSTWLTRIAVYEALARARRRARFDETDTTSDKDCEYMDSLRSTSPDPEQQASLGELQTLLDSAIDALPEHFRAVFVMRDVEGMSTAETAECLELTQETTKTRLHRARTLLRQDLHQRAGIANAAAFLFHVPRCDRVVAGVLERIESLKPARRVV
jgi:RNA polymerase sigma-70 factor (ECF subfamily)